MAAWLSGDRPRVNGSDESERKARSSPRERPYGPIGAQRASRARGRRASCDHDFVIAASGNRGRAARRMTQARPKGSAGGRGDEPTLRKIIALTRNEDDISP